MAVNLKMSPAHKQWAILKGFATREEEDARAQEEAQVKCNWDEIDNKPEVFKPEEHTHNQYATTEDVEKKIAALVDSAPETLDTLKELADALNEKGDATAIVEQIASVDAKVDAISLESLGYEEPDLTPYALKSELPVLPEDHVTKKELEDVVASIPSVDGLASEKFVEEKIAAVDHSSYAVKSEVEASINEVKNMIPEVPSHEKVVEYQDFTFNGQARKTIQLDNYDSISGVATTGESHNLVMLSKWDVADFGATGVHLNLNTKDTVTINDKQVVATVDDVTKAVAEVEAKIPTIPSHDQYALKTDIPSVVNFATKEEVATAKSEAILAASGDASAKYATIETVEELKASIPTLPENHVSKEDLESAVANVVKYEDFTYNGESRKTIRLDNYNNISGITTDGSGVNLAMISKWDVADFGAPSVHMNLNTKMYELEDGSTYPAITINDKPEWAIATVEYVGQQVNAVKDSIPSIPTDHVTTEELAAAIFRIGNLEDKVSDLSKTNVTPVVAGAATTVNDATADLVIAASETPITATTSFTGKSVDVKSMNIESAKVKMKAVEGDLSITGYTSSGNIDGSVVEIEAYCGEHVKITNCTLGQGGYNAINIGNSSTTVENAPKSILIDNVKLNGIMRNNAINIYGQQNNAVITISNCHFAGVSNPVRLFNTTNTNCTVNLINCTVDAWEADANEIVYSGFLICEEISSATVEEEITNNRFGKDKITVNFINCYGPHGKIESADPASYCGVANENQLVYVFRHKLYKEESAADPNNLAAGILTYGDGSAYPNIVIK